MTTGKTTQGPWCQGEVIPTAITKRWSKEVFDGVQQFEKRSVFADLRFRDEGRSRRLIATFERAEDARLGAAAPELLEAVYAALPFVEDALNDPAYKAGAVKKYLDQMKTAIAKAEGRDVA